jgi:hypothetical protein
VGLLCGTIVAPRRGRTASMTRRTEPRAHARLLCWGRAVPSAGRGHAALPRRGQAAPSSGRTTGEGEGHGEGGAYHGEREKEEGTRGGSPWADGGNGGVPAKALVAAARQAASRRGKRERRVGGFRRGR